MRADSTRHLFAFLNRQLIARFDATEQGAKLTYLHDTPTPISLSLQPGAELSETHAFDYLDNLLPENERVRDRWAFERGIPNDTFSLLGEYGEDLAGAISLSPHEELAQRDPQPLVEATVDDIAYHISRLTRDPNATVQAHDFTQRLSLAGVQAKFSLSRIAESWFWSTFESPSTHIFKPPSPAFAKVDFLEQRSLEIASALGINASQGKVTDFLEQPTFMVERWDRTQGHRVHAEDLAQALGIANSSKYDIAAHSLAELLEKHDHQQAIEFVRQLAFNIAIGNADAHVKNYSVLLDGQSVRLAPLYDAVPTIMYPRLSTRLAMSIGGIRQVGNLGRSQWHKFASLSGLDPDEVTATVVPVMTETAEQLPDLAASAGLDSNAVRLVDKHRKLVVRSVQQLM